MKKPSGIRGHKGQSAVEFALVIIFFIIFLIALTDMVRICYNWVSLQYAVNEAARESSLNRNGRTLVDTIATNLGISTADVTLIDVETNLPIAVGSGSPLKFVKLRIHNQVLLSLPSAFVLQLMGNPKGTYDFNVETIIRNEPFGN